MFGRLEGVPAFYGSDVRQRYRILILAQLQINSSVLKLIPRSQTHRNCTTRTNLKSRALLHTCVTSAYRTTIYDRSFRRESQQTSAMWSLLRNLSTIVTLPPYSSPSIRSFKVVSAVRRRCSDCRIVRRGKKIYVLCETNPRHKQRQGKKGSLYAKS